MLALFIVASVTGAAFAGPCDVYSTAGSPCVGAFSLLRALYTSYAGPLYTVRRASDNFTAPVGLLKPGGYANSSAQDAFCAGTSCQIYHIVDQSPYGNDLAPAPPGGSARHVDNGVNASALPLTLPDGSRAYGAFFESGLNQGYRIDTTQMVARGNEAETIYMVTSGLPGYTNAKCCFDWGNAEANNLDTGEGSMEAVYMGSLPTAAKGWCGGSGGDGPFVMADLESGVWACADRNVSNPKALPQTSTFVTALVKGYGDVPPYGRWAIKAGNAAQGPLSTQFDGPRPAQAPKRAPYYPMRLTGSIILGIGGDNSDGGTGVFFEGVVCKGASPETGDDAVQADLNAFYSKVKLL